MPAHNWPHSILRSPQVGLVIAERENKCQKLAGNSAKSCFLLYAICIQLFNAPVFAPIGWSWANAKKLSNIVYAIVSWQCCGRDKFIVTKYWSLLHLLCICHWVLVYYMISDIIIPSHYFYSVFLQCEEAIIRASTSCKGDGGRERSVWVQGHESSCRQVETLVSSLDRLMKLVDLHLHKYVIHDRSGVNLLPVYIYLTNRWCKRD